MGNFKQDMGNNESLTRGLFSNDDGTFTVLTFCQSKTLKTKKGAVKWLAKRGLDEKGFDIE